MTSTFSTIVNFSMKGILERMHKLHYLSMVEASNEIVFPRVNGRLLQLKEKTELTLSIPSIKDLKDSIFRARHEAITKARECGITLPKYGDEHLLFPSNEALIQSAIENDHEHEDIETVTSEEIGLTRDEAILINEDISNIKLIEQSSSNMPLYVEKAKESSTTRNFSLYNAKGKSQFINYHGAFIRKSTALYLLQENKQLSNDRLLRVCASQPGHIFSGNCEAGLDQEHIVRSGDLCFFKRVDSEKILIGRVIQFSYLEGNKKDRQYSSSYVDTSLDSVHNIGVFANWYQGKQANIQTGTVSFVPADSFTTGYLAMENFVSTIKELVLEDDETGSFSISKDNLTKMKPNWESLLTFDLDFFE